MRHFIAAGPALFVFFRTTCKSSLIAIDLYGEIERRYGDVIPVVAIAQDPYERARAWLGDHFFAGELLTDFPAYQASAAYRLVALPTALLVGRDAAVLEVLIGWNRDDINALAVRMGRMTARGEGPVSSPDDGRIPFRPG